MHKVVPLLLLAAFGAALKTDRVTLEGPLAAPRNWAKISTPAPADKMTVYLFMTHKPGAETSLKATLEAVSDPKSSQYGQHMSLAELSSLLAPAVHHQAAVQGWLAEHNVTTASSTHPGDLVQLELSVEQAEAMFNTQVHQYSHPSGAITLRAVGGHSLPAHVAAAVTVVGDLSQFPPPQKKPVVTTVKATAVQASRALLGSGATGNGNGTWPNDCTGPSGHACKGYVTPGVLKARYNLPDRKVSVSKNNSMAVAEFEGEHYGEIDLDTFSAGCDLTPGVKVARYIGDKNVQVSSTEAMLDIEYIRAVAAPVPLTVYYSDSGSFLQWIKTVGSTPNPEWVHSVSYGSDEKTLTPAFMNQVDVQLQAIGVRGISILFSAGDAGVYGTEDDKPHTGNGTRFSPDFPCGSAFVTAVGGTDFVTYSIGDEMAWSGGGGGFSDTFARPSYQEAAVSGYLKDSSAALPPASAYNATGRGYPDVSALAGEKTPYCVFSQVEILPGLDLPGAVYQPVAGTSASSPVVAGIFALLNDIRLSAGKPPLGFLNPFIYQNAAAFNDVQSGKNNNGNGEGFNAIKGWDAASGVGTPNYEALAKIVAALS